MTSSGSIDRTATTSTGTSQSSTQETVSTEPATETGSDAVTLSWMPPTTNADGTPLMDLQGYKVHYGPSSKSYSETIQVANAGLTTYVVQNLDHGKYYFAVTTYNSAGQESSLSGEVSTQVD